jgi:hypothetical protein
MGEKHAAIPWERLTYDPALEAYRVDLSDTEITGAPSHKSSGDFDWGDRSAEIEIHNYYGARPYWGAY